MSRRLFFTRNRPANVDNHYVVGSGVGSKSRFVRSALRRRSSNNSQGKPCCHSIPKKKDDVLSKLEEEKNCTGGMVWKECGSACTRTCSDPEPLCTKQCVPKCECPDGQVLEGGQCTQKYNCPYQNQCDHGFSPYKIKDTSMCCWTDDIGPDGSGCSNLNSVCYLGASGGLLQVCPKSNIIKCAEVKYKCDTQKGSCVPDLTGTEASYNICTSNCSPQPLPPTPFTCATSPGSAEDKMFPHGNLKNDARWKSNFPKASELDSDIDKRAAGTAFGPNSYNWINTTPGSIDSIELAKIWILATHGFKKHGRMVK